MIHSEAKWDRFDNDDFLDEVVEVDAVTEAPFRCKPPWPVGAGGGL